MSKYEYIRSLLLTSIPHNHETAWNYWEIWQPDIREENKEEWLRLTHFRQLFQVFEGNGSFDWEHTYSILIEMEEFIATSKNGWAWIVFKNKYGKSHYPYGVSEEILQYIADFLGKPLIVDR